MGALVHGVPLEEAERLGEEAASLRVGYPDTPLTECVEGVVDYEDGATSTGSPAYMAACEIVLYCARKVLWRGPHGGLVDEDDDLWWLRPRAAG